MADFNHKNCCECIMRSKEQLRDMYARLYDDLVNRVNQSIGTFNQITTPIAESLDVKVNNSAAALNTVYDKIIRGLADRVASAKGDLEPICQCANAGDLRPTIQREIERFWDSLNPPFNPPAPESTSVQPQLAEDRPRPSTDQSTTPKPAQAALLTLDTGMASRVPTGPKDCPQPIDLTCCPLTIFNILLDKDLQEKMKDSQPTMQLQDVNATPGATAEYVITEELAAEGE